MANSTLRKRTARKTTADMTSAGPRTSTINAILNFSKALNVVEAPPVGKVAIVLN